MLLFILTVGSWKPAIGDPSIMGWFTVFSYYLAAAFLAFKMVSQKASGEKKIWRIWGIMCLFMLALGLQKQFNLLSAVTEAGRIIAASFGWMGQHRLIQAFAMILCFLMGMIFVRWLYRRFFQSYSALLKIAFCGLTYLILFVTLRAISLHQFGTLLSFEIGGIRLNWIAELLGICWVMVPVFLPDQRMESG